MSEEASWEKAGETFEGALGKTIAGWKIVEIDRRGCTFTVKFEHITSKEIKVVSESERVWREQGIPVLLAKAVAQPPAISGLKWKWDHAHDGIDRPEPHPPTWRAETLAHIHRVQDFLNRSIIELIKRAERHDASKLEEPEASVFAEYTAKLKGCTYGSDEYKQFLKDMKPALDHHYRMGRHHPEHFPSGIECMNLVDLLEMVADWIAASERHADGSIVESIRVNMERFGISMQLAQILLNTAYWMRPSTQAVPNLQEP